LHSGTIVMLPGSSRQALSCLFRLPSNSLRIVEIPSS
jgi:uncharacterized protein YjeT (DUF2065 family)